MSRRHPSNYMFGRFKFGVSDSNLDDDDDDSQVEAGPRGQPGSHDLYVAEMDTCSSINKPAHLTHSYGTNLLVVRRGFEVFFRVTFNRLLTEADEFQMEFLIGRNPSASNGSMVTVTFRGQSGRWPGHIVEMQDTTVTVSFTPSPDAIVGRYRTYVNIITTTGVIKSQKDHDYDFYLLFNAWCKSDVVYLANEADRHEYVLNDNGVIFMGSATAISQRDWMYGQFEHGVLEACIYLMDAAKMPIKERNKVLKVIRVGSAMCNAQDDHGVLVGNWGDDFSMGTAPMAWTGSAKILKDYASTGLPVCYAQCWVFAGVFNTFLRCLGIPARVVTNFSSAHDNTGNLKTDLIFHSDGTPDEASTTDSIWNFHVWNEVWMKRTDILAEHGMDGWQVVDATPQETSDGYYRCGPAAVKAIKEGNVSHPFDTGFVFAEVNSDVVFYKKDKYGSMSPFEVDTKLVGQCVCTKAVGSRDRMDITHTYKHQEGSSADRATMERAESQGVERDHSNIPEQPIKVIIHAKEGFVGSDIELDIEFYNPGDLEIVAEALMFKSVIYYTGVISNNMREMNFVLTIPGQNTTHVPVRITASEYLPALGSQLSMRFLVYLNINGQPVSAMKVVNLKTKELKMELTGTPVVNQDMFVTVSFTNPYNFPISNIFFFMEGSGVMDRKSYFSRTLEPGRSITWQEEFRPRLQGLRGIVAAVYCNMICMYGYVIMNVT